MFDGVQFVRFYYRPGCVRSRESSMEPCANMEGIGMRRRKNNKRDATLSEMHFTTNYFTLSGTALGWIIDCIHDSPWVNSEQQRGRERDAYRRIRRDRNEGKLRRTGFVNELYTGQPRGTLISDNHAEERLSVLITNWKLLYLNLSTKR